MPDKAERIKRGDTARRIKHLTLGHGFKDFDPVLHNRQGMGPGPGNHATGGKGRTHQTQLRSFHFSSPQRQTDRSQDAFRTHSPAQNGAFVPLSAMTRLIDKALTSQTACVLIRAVDILVTTLTSQHKPQGFQAFGQIAG